jgi:hypothetical protein
VVRLPIQQLLSNSLVDPRRHLDLDRVQRYTQLDSWRCAAGKESLPDSIERPPEG